MSKYQCPHCNALLINHIEWGRGEPWCRRCKRMVGFVKYPPNMNPEAREMENVKVGGLTGRPALR